MIIKLSEALSSIKQMEGELMRLWERRDLIIKSENEYIQRNNTLLPEDVEVAQKKFLKEKAEKVVFLDAEINALISKIIELKVKVNRKNVEVDLDVKLQSIKYHRIELSKLMNIIRRGRHRYSDEGLDPSTREVLDMDGRIKMLEKKKAALDAEIQSVNWSTKID